MSPPYRAPLLSRPGVLPHSEGVPMRPVRRWRGEPPGDACKTRGVIRQEKIQPRSPDWIFQVKSNA